MCDGGSDTDVPSLSLAVPAVPSSPPPAPMESEALRMEASLGLVVLLAVGEDMVALACGLGLVLGWSMNNDEMIYRQLVSTLPTDFPSLSSCVK